ncbi:MAG: hypothetical protein Sv326_0307 [Candidatus Fermentimicrarchaeum limneticum]|uniref:Uncharacterized protein n=1 Tax=Fermentimicrarchaeum limneticum TaxID=2795018 RepID=A0A7D6BN82_FERL1|nr:MAG: hypothetical protein Sv326_0307 [Candidatus Fermentimicrarchaeum limneticum]
MGRRIIVEKILQIALALLIFSNIAYADVLSPEALFGRPPSITDFVISLILTLIVELSVSYIYIQNHKLPQKILISVTIANIVSLPFIWVFVVIFQSLIPILCGIPLLFAEMGVTLLEFAVIYLMNKECLNQKEAFTISLMNNLASFILWLIIVFFRIYQEVEVIYKNIHLMNNYTEG